MKQVDKVSIGKMAFVIDKDARVVLEEYLDSLAEYYSGNPAHSEILTGIEERIAELLGEKGYRDRNISVEVIDEIIHILGRPDDLKIESEPQPKKRKKRLFRNPDNKILGGVFGGLGVYCGVDPIIFRLIFGLLFVFSLFMNCYWEFADDLFLYLSVIYILMWIIMPKARTREDKCAMYGEGTSVQDIQSGVEQGFRTMKEEVGEMYRRRHIGSAIGRGFAIFFGVIMFLAGLGGMICALLSIIGIGTFANILMVDIPDIFGTVLMAPTWVGILFKIFATLGILIPPVVLLYWSVQLLFKLQSPKWRPGMIMVITWFISIIMVVILAIAFTTSFRHSTFSNKSTSVEFSDTVYVKFADVERYKDYKVILDGDRNDFHLIYVSANRNQSEIVKYPDIHIYRNNEESSRVGYRVEYLYNSLETMKMSEEELLGFWSFDGDTLAVDPVIFKKGVSPREIHTEINIVTDHDTKFIITEPINFSFQKDIGYSNIRAINALTFID